MPHPYLAVVRAALNERIDAVHLKAQRSSDVDAFALPYRLVSAGCWLVANGYEGDATPAEKALGWGPNRYRQYLDTLSADARAAEVEEGRAVLFDGRRPIYAAPVREMAA